MSEIVIQRDDPTMDLDESEQALLDEIEIDPTPLPVRRAHKSHGHHAEHEMVDDPVSFMNPDKRSGPTQNYTSTEEEPIDYGEMGDDDPVFPEGPSDVGGVPQNDGPTEGFASIDDEKADILNKLTRLSQKKGIHVNKRLNMYSSIDELRAEVKRVRYSIEVDQSVKFSRRMLVATITGLEFMNKRYDPFDLKLDGWSESVMENAEDYDECFEDLYLKYRSSVKVPPEVKLIMMVGGSGMMFHLTNSMFKSVMPNVNDVMKQNPDLMQNMMSAVQNTMGASGGAPPLAQETQSGGRREMRGPPMDLGSMMGGMGGMGNLMNGLAAPPPANPMPPHPVNTFSRDKTDHQLEQEIDDMSDIVSVVSAGDIDIRDINVKAPTRRRGRKKKVEKNEVSM